MAEDNRNKPLYMISVAAELTGMHPQTLRVYESKGLVNPQRSGGNTRLYSRADIERLELINQLTDEGINLAGVVRILDMKERAEERERENEKLRARVRQLEDELHERLFLRTTKSLAITPRGRELYEYAAHVLSLQDRLLSSWSEDQHLIRLGSSTIPSAYILPELLPQYRRLHPEATFAIHQSDSADVLDGLRKGQFELALVGMEEPEEDLAFTPFYRDSMVLITPNTAYFSALSPDGATVAELLRSQPLLLREPGSGSQRSVDAFFRSIGLEPSSLSVSARLNDQESVRNLVAGGLGISIVSEIAVRSERHSGRLLVFPLPNDTASRSLCLACRRGDYLRPQALQFMEFARSFYV